MNPYYPWENKKVQDPDSKEDGFCVLHPDRGPDNIDAVVINHGLNADFTALPESQWFRCRKCGFVLNAARHPKGWGIGTTVDETADPYDPVTTAGCPLCGTFIYN